MSNVCKEAILERLGGNYQLFEAVCDRFTTFLPAQMSVIAEAISLSDAETLRRSTHRLRGSVGYFDSQPVLATISELEVIARKPTFEDVRAQFLFDRLSKQLTQLVGQLDKLRS